MRIHVGGVEHKIGGTLGAQVEVSFLLDRVDQKVVIGEPLENYPSGDEVEDTKRMNEVIESMIRTGPEQYFWVHKRFKTQPTGADRFYK